jgi:hypothetical protein
MPKKLKIPKGRWSKQLSSERMLEVGKAYRERAEQMQRRPATIVESPKAKLQRELKAMMKTSNANRRPT